MKMRSGKLSLYFWVVVIVMGTCLVPVSFGQSEKGQEAWKAYTEYFAAREKAKSLDDIVMYLTKERADEVEQAPEEDREFMFEIMKMTSDGISDLKVDSEEWTGDEKVMFLATGKNEEQGGGSSVLKAKISMVKEADGWKMHKESFSVSDD